MITSVYSHKYGRAILISTPCHVTTLSLATLKEAKMRLPHLSKSRSISLQFPSTCVKNFSKYLKLSSSSCALTGGILLASNTSISRYGFVFLAMSSGQLLLASLQDRDSSMIFYAASLFIFVDCLGVYRWVLT